MLVSNHTYTFEEFDLAVADPETTDTKQIKAGQGWQQVFRRDLTEQEYRGLADHFGRANTSNPQQAEAFAGLRLVSDAAAAQAAGKFRIAVRTQTGEVVDVLVEGDLNEYDLFDGAGDMLGRGDRHPFPNTRPPLNFTAQPYVITIDLKPRSDITVDEAETQTAARLEGRQAKRTE